MYPRGFRYVAPKNLQEAARAIRANADEAKLLAGGMSLIPMMKLRIASPTVVVDINRTPGLSYIKADGGRLLIGPLTRHADIERSDLVAKVAPLLSEAAPQIADRQVRNRGTMAGSLCHADPAADWPAVTLACDAEFAILGEEERVVKAQDFFRGPFETALESGEILKEVRVPLLQSPHGYAYLKFAREIGDFATLGVAVLVTLVNGGHGDEARIGKVSIALTAVAPKQFRATDAEEALSGKPVSPDLIATAAKLASDQCEPPVDLRGSVEYKKKMAEVFTGRAIKLALKRAGWKAE